jgi:hypothetical protein
MSSRAVQVEQALRRMEGPVAPNPPSLTPRPAKGNPIVHDSSSQQQRPPATALEWPVRRSGAASACAVNDSLRSLNAQLADAAEAGGGSGSGSGSEEGSNQQASGGQKGDCTASAGVKPCTETCAPCVGGTGAAAAAPQALNTVDASSLGSDKSSGARTVVPRSPGPNSDVPGGAGSAGIGAEATANVQAAAQQQQRPESPAEGRQRGCKRRWSSPSGPGAAPDAAEAGRTQNAQTQQEQAAACRVEPTHSTEITVAEHVRLKWQHIEPVAIHLFDSYTRNETCSAIPDRQQQPTDTCTGHSGPCKDGMYADSRTQHQRFPVAVRGAKDRISMSIPGRKGSKATQLRPWLESISGDLQALSRFRSLDVVSVVQPTLDAGLTQPRRRMVSAVALDRCDQILAVVGVYSYIPLSQ